MSIEIRRLATALSVAGVAWVCIGSAAASAESFAPSDVYRSAAKSVVFIFGTHSGNAGASGTGTVISKDGLILTNNHVIADDAGNRPYKKLEVYFKPEPTTGDVSHDLRRGYPAQVVARDPDLDLAVIQVQDIPRSAAPIVFGRSGAVDVGSSVAAIGHPKGGGLWTLTTGTISSSRTLGNKPVFQSQASLNPGNSGGPLLDGAAHMIGINTAIIRSTNDGVATEGLNFSVKSDAAVSWLSGQGIRVDVAHAQAVVPAAGEQVPEPEPDTLRETVPRPRPEIVEESAPAPDAEIVEETLPEPRPEIVEESVPTPNAETVEETVPRVTPEASAESPDGAEQDDERVFQGPNGEEMYGVPNTDFDPENAEHELIARIKQKAQKAFDELDDADF